MTVEKRIVVGASGASGMPLLMKCLEILRDSEEYRSLLVMSRSAKLTLEQETDWSVSQVEALADEVLDPDNIGAGPASGSYRTEGMVIVPCSMKNGGRYCKRIHRQSAAARGGCNDQGETPACTGSTGDTDE